LLFLGFNRANVKKNPETHDWQGEKGIKPTSPGVILDPREREKHVKCLPRGVKLQNYHGKNLLSLDFFKNSLYLRVQLKLEEHEANRS
jgi:hypothetical protein